MKLKCLISAGLTFLAINGQLSVFAQIISNVPLTNIPSANFTGTIGISGAIVTNGITNYGPSSLDSGQITTDGAGNITSGTSIAAKFQGNAYLGVGSTGANLGLIHSWDASNSYPSAQNVAASIRALRGSNAYPAGALALITASAAGVLQTNLYVDGITGGTFGNGSYFTTIGAGSVARSLGTKANDVIYVDDFGADNTGIADSTQSITNAFNAAATLNRPVVFNGGTYKVTSLNEAWSYLTISGAGSGLSGGTTITGGSNGYPMLDMLRASFCNVKNLSFQPSPGIIPSCGILMGRESTSDDPSGNNFENITIGANYSFSVACFYSIAAELCNFYNCVFMQSSLNTNACATWYMGRTTTNIFSSPIASLFHTITYTGNGGSGGNIFVGCKSYSFTTNTNSCNWVLDFCQGTGFYGCYIGDVGCTNQVVLTNGCSGLTWNDGISEITVPQPTLPNGFVALGPGVYQNINIDGFSIFPIYGVAGAQFSDVNVESCSLGSYIGTNSGAFAINVDTIRDSKFRFSQQVPQFPACVTNFTFNVRGSAQNTDFGVDRSRVFGAGGYVTNYAQQWFSFPNNVFGNVSGGVDFLNPDWVGGSTGSGLVILSGASSGNTFMELQSLINGSTGAGTLALNPGGGDVDAPRVGVGVPVGTATVEPLSVNSTNAVIGDVSAIAVAQNTSTEAVGMYESLEGASPFAAGMPFKVYVPNVGLTEAGRFASTGVFDPWFGIYVTNQTVTASNGPTQMQLNVTNLFGSQNGVQTVAINFPNGTAQFSSALSAATANTTGALTEQGNAVLTNNPWFAAQTLHLTGTPTFTTNVGGTAIGIVNNYGDGWIRVWCYFTNAVAASAGQRIFTINFANAWTNPPMCDWAIEPNSAAGGQNGLAYTFEPAWQTISNTTSSATLIVNASVVTPATGVYYTNVFRFSGE